MAAGPALVSQPLPLIGPELAPISRLLPGSQGLPLSTLSGP
jgi:hypothetical protein